MKTAIWTAAALSITTMPLTAQPAATERVAIERAMDGTAAAWSKGDLDGFLDIYSNDPGTSFVTADGVIRGKAAMRAMYQKTYSFDDASKRGVLRFATQDFRPLGKGKALLISRYTLTYPDGKTTTGLTSVIFSREAKGWRIVADHSS